VVGHGKTAGLAGALLSGSPDPQKAVGDFVIDHGAFSRWQWGRLGWQLRSSNESGHLRPEP